MTATVSKSVPAESLEDSILRGLRAWQEKYPNGDGPRDRDLEGDIYSLLYVTLPGVAAVLPGVGWKANDPRGDYGFLVDIAYIDYMGYPAATGGRCSKC